MDPINYDLNVQQPFQAALQGYQAGAGIRNDQLQYAQQQQAVAAQQNQIKALQNLMSNPNAGAQDYSNAMLLAPGMREQINDAWKVKNEQQQQNELAHMSQAFGALTGGAPDVAEQMFTDRAKALASSGSADDAKHQQFMADLIHVNPQLARVMLGKTLSGIPGGDKMISSVVALNGDTRAEGLQPSTVQKSQADADKASVEAANAQTVATLGNQKTAEEIKGIQLKRDLDKLDGQIKTANSETERGKLQLERDKLANEIALRQQGQANAAQNGMNGISDALQTVSQIKTHPGMDGYFTGPGTTWGAIWGNVPGSERQALGTWVDTLKSQLTRQNLDAMKAASPTGASGLGALSDGEREMLATTVANLNLNSKDFPQQLARAERFLQKAQSTSVARGQLPNQGEAFVMKHPQFGNVTEGTINGLLKMNPGSTREQVLQFLKQSGGH